GGGNAQADPPCSRAVHSELPRSQGGEGEMKTRLSTVDGAGIVSFGHYVPYQRVDMKVFSEQWGVPAQLERMYRLNGRNRVAVNAADEDTVTLAVAAAERALLTFAEPPIASVMVGSESHPYAVKPTSVIVAD